MNHVIQYGLFPYFKDLFQFDFCNKACTFKFDEATTLQVKK